MLRSLTATFGVLLALASGPAQARSAFADWSAVVVAGDWHAADGGATEGFDNARRDVTQALARVGFLPANMRQFSVRPERYPDTKPEMAEPRGIYAAMSDLAAKTPGGCLFYLTSHGLPEGAQVDQGILRPGVLGEMLDRACGKRPSVVVISACYSGVFLPALSKPNRMVLTAARPDRTSFGCGQDNKYPFFDECFLSSMGSSRDFGGLAGAVTTCVRSRETVEGVSPASEPQLWIGAELRPMLPLYPFARVN